MYRQEGARKRQFADPRKRHFTAAAPTTPSSYPHRLNFYTTPPVAEITLDQFEQWAIDRLRVLSEIENCLFRNKSPGELKVVLTELCKKYLRLEANSTRSPELAEQRRKDHYSHFILRLAFARSEELRKRFSRIETILFRHRFETDDAGEREEFIRGLGLDWEEVGEEERRELGETLAVGAGKGAKREDGYFKVDWERVAELVEQRKVFVRRGKAYVPGSLKVSLVVGEFTGRLEQALELTARALPRLDEDDRLIPILNHLSQGFTAPEYDTSSAPTFGAAITAGAIDGLAQHFPACMLHLHRTLRHAKHLKHYGRLQYTLFLKGIGLSVEEALVFWRTGFANTPEDKFNKEYRYNVRHAYGLEGNRRNYKPHSCQQIILDHPPGPGEAHGCPYRHFPADNLMVFLQQQMGVTEKDVLQGVRKDVEAKKYHMACNRVFEAKHRDELAREKAAGRATGETLIHPNEYFARSFELTHPDAARGGADAADVADTVMS